MLIIFELMVDYVSSVSLLPLSPLCLQLKLITGSMDHPVHPIENYVVPCTSPPETWESGPKTVKEYLSRIRSTLNGRILHCVAHIVVRDRIIIAVHRNGRPQPPSSTAAASFARAPSSATTINRPWTWIYHALDPISWATNINRS